MRDIGSAPKTTIARRDLSALSREKTIVLAILIQLFIATFSSFLVVGLTSLYDPGSVAGGEISVGISGEERDKLAAAAREAGLDPFIIQDTDNALQVFERGDIDALLTVSRVEGEEGGDRLDVTATVPAEDLRTTLIVVQVRSMLTELERTERLGRLDHLEFVPLEVPEEGDSSPFFGFTYTILIPLLLFLPPFISGSIVVDSITEEIERGTLELLRVAPVSMTDIVDGKAAAMVAIAPAQALLWLALLWVNGIAIGNVLPLLVLVTALALVTVVVGVFLGLVTGKRRQAQLLYSVLVLLLFALAAALPEHPGQTVALLSVDSATRTTFLHVAGFSALAVALYAGARQYVRRLDPESL
ncbi:MAG: ABC transporter permease [Halovenus sp.]